MASTSYLKETVKILLSNEQRFKANFGKKSGVHKKQGNPRNLVTETDRALEMAFRKKILGRYPNHRFLGEEYGELRNAQNSDYAWIVDPIDGTTNYIQGIPYCCMAVALMRKNRPMMGAVYNPITSELYTAEIGRGTRLNGRLVHVSKTAHLADALGCLSWGKDAAEGMKMVNAFFLASRKGRVQGSTTLDICGVALGRYDFAVSGRQINLWDVAAATVIVEEAGGTVTANLGKKVVLTDSPEHMAVIAANPKLHQEILEFRKKKKV
ncbi:MAG: inositol monophosphatase [Patescibacteria group bacterium]|nr:inositol monophosphatase [Patescibacteria group bacterium]